MSKLPLNINTEMPSTLICKFNYSDGILLCASSLIQIAKDKAQGKSEVKGVSLEAVESIINTKLTAELIKEGLIDHTVDIKLTAKIGNLENGEVHYCIEE